MSGQSKAKTARAEAYILAHPDETKEQQAMGSGCSSSLIATIRARLIRQKRLAPTRKMDAPLREHKPAREPEEATPPVVPKNKKTDEMLDHDAMAALAKMIEEIEGLDDEEILRRLQRQCLLFAMNHRLHPDTRMSASQMWTKLKDQAKTKDLGPGAPLTFEDAVARLRDLMVAVGPEITLAAVAAAFTVKEAPVGEETAEQTAPPVGTAENAGPTGHESGLPPVEDVRPLDVEPE